MQSPNRSWQAVFIRELRRYRSRRLYILMTIILPLIGFGFFTALFNTGKPTDLPVAIYDQDQSKLSQQMLSNIDQGATVMLTDHPTDLKAAKEGLKKGDYYAVLIVPKDFEQDIYRNAQPEVVLYYNNAYMVVGSLISSEIQQTIAFRREDRDRPHR